MSEPEQRRTPPAFWFVAAALFGAGGAVIALTSGKAWLAFIAWVLGVLWLLFGVRGLIRR